MRVKMLTTIVFNMALTMVFAQEDEGFNTLDNPDVLKTGLEQMAANTKTIQTSFRQKKYIKILANALESEGEMYFKKPQMLKWAYTTPYDYAIIFRKDEIVINDEGKISSFDISSSKAFLEINEVIVNSVSGNVLQGKQFEISYFENNSFYLAKLTPKIAQMRSYIAVIELYINKEDYTVSRIKLVEKGDDYTLIDLFDHKLNVEISDETFAIN